MSLARSFAPLLFAAGLFSAAPASEAAELYHARSFTLANGLMGVVIEDHRAPVVTHMVWYRTGAADDPVGKSGISHFLEHLMFKGTPSVPANEFARIVARNGGRENAFTTHDYTAFFEDVAADKLELVMQLEADRMAHLSLADDQVTPERQVILEERRERTDNEPAALFEEQLAAAQYLASPYRLPVLGWKHEMEGLSRSDALAYYRAHYAPNNAFVVVVGDVTFDRVRQLAEQYYGANPRRRIALRMRPQEPPQIAGRRLLMEDPRVRQASWSRSYLAPSAHAGETKYALPLLLLADVIGNNTSSRMYKALILGDGIATSAGAEYSPFGLEPGTFELAVVPKPGVPPAAVEAKVEKLLADVVAEGVTEGELERAKIGYRASAIYERDSIGGTARLFGAALATGLSIADVEAWPERVAAVSLAEVNDAARYIFDIRKSVTGVLLPKPAS